MGDLSPVAGALAERFAGSFAERFAAVRAARGPLVWGLDPSGRLLEEWGLGDNPDGLDRFVDTVLPVAVDTLGLVKPQSAFYERHGWRGMRALTRLMTGARAAGLLVVLDAKRGDVGSTNDAYAEAYLGKGAPLESDALTVHPYLGLGAMEPFIRRAELAGGCVLVVTRSSNPEGRPVQAPVEAALLEEIGRLNAGLAPGGVGPVGPVGVGPVGPVGPVGAVIGARPIEPALDLAAAQALFLAPGVGAQGAGPADVARQFAACPDRVMPSASRSLLEHGPDPGRLAGAVAGLADEFRRVLG
jgi:orotidine-5'-phosphate decarboxylase